MIKKISPEQLAAEKAAIIAASRPTGRPRTSDDVRLMLWQYRDLAPELNLTQFCRFLAGRGIHYSLASVSRYLRGYTPP